MMKTSWNLKNSSLRCLADCTFGIASEITAKNPQCVTMIIDHGRECYKIVFGMPPDSQRHGIGEVGFLQTPTKKIALLDAIKINSIIISQCVANDDRFSYMREHALSKRIESVAIVPIASAVDDKVFCLIIIDKIWPNKVFSEQELQSLADWKKYIEKEDICRLDIISTANHAVENLLDEYAHIIRNRLTMIGLSATLIKKHVKNDIVDTKKIVEYSNTIEDSTYILEKEFTLLNKIKTFALKPREKKIEQIPLKKILYIFNSSSPNFLIMASEESLETEVLLDSEAVSCLFDGLKRMAESGKKLNEKTIILAEEQLSSNIKITIKNSCFLPAKLELGHLLPLLNHISNHFLGNDLIVEEGKCELFFPLAKK